MATGTLPIDAQILADLVVEYGSRAGTSAPLVDGFYLIGRDAECQIRPKSRTVSRQHCLLQLSELGVQVMDLGSTSGTKMHGEKIPPKVWQVVRNGDVLKLGKVAFRVVFADDYEPSAEVYRLGDPSKTSDQMEAASMDVGEFLEEEDLVDPLQDDGIELSDDDLFVETILDEPLSSSDDASDVQIGISGDDSLSSDGEAGLASAAKPVAPAKPKAKSKDASRQKFKKKKIRSSSGGLSMPDFSRLIPQDGDGLKLVLAIAIMLAAGGIAAYQIFGGGGAVSRTRVIPNLD
ncbi:MAG: FHA domain-containing protein [Planctomycetota bacterium]